MSKNGWVSKADRAARNARMGTHNRLLRLGPSLFLEMIAPDPTNPTPPQRWFSLGDAVTLSSLERNGPRLVTWVVRTDDIAVAARSPIALGPVARVARGQLEWSIAASAGVVAGA